ncbi:MAG TPA: hypothetical protein VFY18_12215 [Candidatus Limnocylindrales bacterium]|nr:hypothetical protein [Candidatus Limnocylindrales bacterium]
MTGPLRRAILVVAWLLIVAVIAIGAAGLVAAMAHQPGTPSRAELTLDGDRAAAPRLAAIQGQLTDLTGDVKKLGELGRGALGALVAVDSETLATVVADGQTQSRAIETRSAVIREQIALLPGSGPTEELVWSPETRARRDTALQATTATANLAGLWTRLAFGSLTATRLTTLLVNHDQVAGGAAALIRKAKYAAGLTELTKADKIIADSRALRDALQNTVDVTTLTQWLDRNAEYDAALRRLAKAVIASKGTVTKEVRNAAIAERKAHDLLPANTSGLVIILAEIGRGGLNQAVIGIEEARGQLQAAVDRLGAQPDASDEPTTSPAP